jgi:GNAT superfamily N-acetyltransferase
MYTIRQAHIDDVPVLAMMGEKFYQYSAFNKYVPYDVESVASKLAQLLLTGFLYVAEHEEDGVVAALAGTMTTLWFNNGLPVASEMAWWVEEKHRNSPVGIRLYKAFEKWAFDRGVTTITMSDLVIEDQAPADKLFKKMGYSVVERAHIKRG